MQRERIEPLGASDLGDGLVGAPRDDQEHRTTGSQGQTADRVLLHVDTDRAGEKLVNRRLAFDLAEFTT